MSAPDVESGAQGTSSTSLESQLQSETTVEAAAEAREVQDRREALRKAGAAFVAAHQSQQLASSSSAAVDNFGPVPAPRPRRKRAERVDPDVVAFGLVFESAKTYLYSTLYVLAAAASPVLIKGSLYSMSAPAVLLVLHMLATALAVWLASTYEVFTLKPISMAAFKGASVSSILGGIQLLCMFSALHHNSVNCVLCWMLVTRQLAEAGAAFLVAGQAPSSDSRMLFSIAAGAAALELVLDRDRVWVGLVMMSLWSAAMALEIGWRHLKADPHASGRITALRLVGLIRECGEEEEALKGASLVFFNHLLPALPVLALGLIAQEGYELANHELSVPAVKTMLLSIACFCVAAGSQLMLADRLSAESQLLLQSLATGGTLLLFFLEEMKTISWLAVACAAVACGAALSVARLRKV